MTLDYVKVDRGGRQIEILLAVSGSLLRGNNGICLLLNQVHALARMSLFQLVLTCEIEDHATGIPLERMQTGLLEVNLAAEVCRVQQVFARDKEKLGLIGSAARPLRTCSP